MHGMTVQKLFVRGLSLTIFVMTIATFWGRTSDAAEITCLKKFTGSISAEKRALALERWPSGRTPNAETCIRALIKGTIIAGDSVKFAQLLRKNHPFLERVLLWSSGGSVEEAMQIGGLIRRGLIETEAPALLGSNFLRSGHLPDDPIICRGVNCNCASACFLIWASGIMRSGHALGLHRPTTKSTSFASLPPDRASILYRKLLSEIATYLGEMEIPQRYIDIMTNTSSSDIRWINDEADSISTPPSVAEWITSSCGSFSKSEEHTLENLYVKPKITLQEKQVRDRLQKKRTEISLCGMYKIDKARDAIKQING